MKKKIEEILTLSKANKELLEKKESSFKKFVNFLEKVLLPLALVILAYATYKNTLKTTSSQLILQQNQHSANTKRISKQHIDDVELSNKQHNDNLELSNKQHANNSDIKYLEISYEKLLFGSKEEKEKVLLLIDEMSPELSLKLSRLAELTLDDKGQKEVAQNKINSSLIRLFNGYRIDIFYVQNVESQKKTAEDIAGILKDSGLSIPIILKPQDTATMKKFGLIVENQVRYERGLEDSQAEELVKLLNKSNAEIGLVKRPVRNIVDTKNYLSIFIK